MFLPNELVLKSSQTETSCVTTALWLFVMIFSPQAFLSPQSSVSGAGYSTGFAFFETLEKFIKSCTNYDIVCLDM